MSYVIFLGFSGMMLGMIGVASNPSPYFAALGLVIAASSGCWILGCLSMTFSSLLLSLVYLGGMLVVFAYSAAMAAEPFPEAWGNLYVIYYMFVYGCVLLIVWGFVNIDVVLSAGDFSMIRCDWGAVSNLYCSGGWVLLFLGWVLLVTLFVVLEITRVVAFMTMV
uniref:NADH-ubiquinone oxidoreductase chain 6 n=1 Tax=Dermophis mexicanus TaxID=118251 RepID=W5RH89_DERME|nr:NADH dehydrogenase subunit 6 [Dermophis mexicanus]